MAAHSRGRQRGADTKEETWMVSPCKCASPHTLNGCLARCQGGGRAGRLGIWKGRGRACGKGHTTVAGAARFRLRQCRQPFRSEEHTSELQSLDDLVCRILTD